MNNHQSGSILVLALVFFSVASVVAFVLVQIAITGLSIITQSTNSEVSFQIAEAGIEYYRWHLAHDPLDFQNGTGVPGPYIMPFLNKEGNQVGTITLDITAPPPNSTIVTVRSKGRLDSDPTAVRTIEVRMGIQSLWKYAVVANDSIAFGAGTEVFGRVHSNGGIHFDGIAHNLVTSAVAEYNDPDHSGGDEFGVHTHISPTDPSPPATVPQRPDVFVAGRQFPVPAIDFAGITADLAALKAAAQEDGLYFDESSSKGYHIVLKTDDTFDLFRVTSLVPLPQGCVEVLGQLNWGSWSIEDEVYVDNYSFPNNGVVFVEDDLWVDGVIDGAQLTIAAATFPDISSKRKNVTINNDLLYTNFDGTDVLAIIAQGNITVGMISEDDLIISGALVAQNGRVGRHYYRPPQVNQDRCSPYHIRQSIILYGMIATNGNYGFAYSDGTGYQSRTIVYDTQFLYAPPISYPLNSNEYQILSWQEIR